MLPDKSYLQVLEHGKNLAKREVFNELEQRLYKLSQRKGIGPKTLKIIYEELGVEFIETDDKPESN